MGVQDIAQEFAKQAQAVESESALYLLVEAATRELGFRYFALTHHVDLRTRQTGVVQLVDYPIGFAEHFVENKIYADDPVWQASQTTNVGFSWTKLPEMIRITPRRRWVLETGAENGLGAGFTVPAHIPGDRNGSCSFVTRFGTPAREEMFPATHLVGAYAFEAANRIAKQEADLPSRPSPQLTERQRECLIFAMRGKTDWETGKILGISEETVSRHINMARTNFGVAKRLPLALRALFDGQISFRDVMK